LDDQKEQYVCLFIYRIYYLHSDSGKETGISNRNPSFVVDFKTAYDKVNRNQLYKVMLEFGIPPKLVRLT
jgi:hypothetical protein